VTLRALAALAAAAVLAGCGGEAAHGTARLWITRDRGQRVLLTTTVPAGLTAIQALRREVKLKTRYGGRFVQAIDGIQGSISGGQDWFWFLNGYEGDRSAGEYRLHPGDVLWWDYRSWKKVFRAPVVVGAFPEPFLHGYGGKRRPSLVIGPRGPATRRLARLLGGARVVARARDIGSANVLRIVPARQTSFRGKLSGGPGGRVEFVYRGDPRRLVQGFARFRYELP
jgi:hypothetical protein